MDDKEYLIEVSFTVNKTYRSVEDAMLDLDYYLEYASDRVFDEDSEFVVGNVNVIDTDDFKPVKLPSN